MRLKIIDWLSGLSISNTIKQIRHEQFLPEAEINDIRNKRLQQLFQTAKQHTSFYKTYDSFSELPVLTKQIVKAHYNEFYSSAYKGKYFKKSTSGSTGAPFHYDTSAKTQSYLWAGLILSWEIAGYKPGDAVGFLAGSAVAKKGWKHKVFYKILNIHSYPVSTLDGETITNHLNAINKAGIRVLYGYAMAVNTMAEYMIQHGIQPPAGLRGIVTTAEELTDKSRRLISEAFGVKVFNQYGCHEAGVSAFECVHQRLHLINGRCIVEIAEDGNLLGTDLANEAFLMLRYDTGDIVEFADEQCTCGRTSPIISSIKGRSGDMITDRSEKKVHSSFFNLLFKDDPDISQYQVLFDEQSICINLKVATSLDEGTRLRYLNILKKHLNFEDYNITVNEGFHTKNNSKHSYIVDQRGQPA